jgi:hypothetical protein
MEDLNMRRISTKFVHQLLNDEQKQQYVFICQEVKNDQNFLSRVITGDKNLGLMS